MKIFGPRHADLRLCALVHQPMSRGAVCMCVWTLVISALGDWLADGVDLSNSAVCQAASASALENMSEGADNW